MHRIFNRNCIKNKVFLRDVQCRSNNKYKNGRQLCSKPALENIPSEERSGFMKAWQIQQFGSIADVVQLGLTRVPPILRPTDVLVKVQAASVNPIDVAVIGGYGSGILNVMKTLGRFEQGEFDCVDNKQFPLTVGRDFAGEVVGVGHGVTDLSVGDVVFGVVSPQQQQGSHAQFVVAPSCNIKKVPTNISVDNAASIPYVALTAWSALVVSGGLNPEQAQGVRVIVLGASGGVGSFVTQLLSTWGAKVAAVCSVDTFELAMSLGASEVHDYNNPETKDILTSVPSFDLVIDASGCNDEAYVKALRLWRGASYVTLSPPLLKNIDKDGYPCGSFKSLREILLKNYNSLSEGRAYKWAFFMPNPTALAEVTKLLAKEKIRPVIDKVYPFNETTSAYEHIVNGPARGKTIIKLD